jgi:hypothetical protein
MSDTNTGGPAFPSSEYDPQYDRNILTGGMTLRDYFAAKAMQAFISAYPCQAIDSEDGGTPVDPQSIAGDAYDVADAMLRARGAA